MRRIVLVAVVLACDTAAPAALDRVPPGTWGGADAGLLVSDSGAHLHIGCTAGDLPAPIALDSLGQFDVRGRYHVRLHPVVYGEPHPARFTGRVTGGTLTVLVALTDTAVVLGPVRLELGREPGMTVCPICRPLPGIPADR